MSDLFDLPFEDDPRARRLRRRLAPLQRSPARAQRDGSDDPDPRSARREVLRGLGRRRAVELPDLEYRTPVLHAEGSIVAGSRLHVPFLAALPEVQARRRPARRRARQDFGLRAEGRVSARLRASRAAGARCAPARLRAVEEAPSGGGLVRRRAQAPAAGASPQNRDRHLARRRRRPRHDQDSRRGVT